MYLDFRKDGWPLCPYCKEDELYSVLMLNWSDVNHPETRPTIAQCMRGIMRCYRCGWGSDQTPRRTFLGHPHVSTPEWPLRYVMPSDAANKTGSLEVQGRDFVMTYHSQIDSIYVPLPLGPQVLDPDDLA